MDFDWYGIVNNDVLVTQGDILSDVPVARMNPISEEPYFVIQPQELQRGIVVTQACDFQKKNIKDITICFIEPFRDLLDRLIKESFGKSDNLNDKQLKQKKFIIEEFRKGHYLDYHLLNKAVFIGKPDLNMDYQVVHLRQSYSVPKDVLLNVYSKKAGERVRLLLPYREHLAQAYARIFNRIGLPIDIKFEEGELD